MSYSDAGSAFIFGSLVGPKMDVLFDGAGFIFAFRVLPAIIFVTALISLLYYIGVMGLLIRILGSIFQKALNISKIESFVAVTTIFLGQNEIPAIVKPFIDRMNRNELFTAICSGMASIAGSMMIGYAGMGVPIDYLLAASLMAIPGGILFARILSPATEPSQVTFENLSFSETPPKSFIEAAASGAMTGLKIAAGVATVVMAFVAIIALINGIIGGIGGWFGFANASLESIFGYVLAPLAWIMGVDWSDANLAGSLIGQKLAINEFVAYLSFSPIPANERHAGSENRGDYLLCALWFCQLWFYRCCRWGIFGYFAKTRAGNRPAWFTGAGSSNAFQPDERDHCRVLYWFSLSFIAGCTPY